MVLIIVWIIVYLLIQARKAQIQAEKANAAKSDFLFNMSHDIRTPMNALLGYSELIKRELTDPKLLDYQEKMEQSGNLLLSIINNVLDMARIESGKVELDEDYVKIRDIYQGIYKIFQAEAEKKGIHLKMEYDVKHEHVICDETKNREIFLNLISNAVKYTASVLSLYVTGKRSLNNAAETYGRQLANGKNLLEQFWDNSKYEQMSETGKKSYLEFQFLRCCGEKMLLISSESKEAVVNRTDYEIVSMDNLGLNNKTDSYGYKIQKLNHKYLLLQHALLTNPEGYEILSVRDVTSMFMELRQTAAWFLGIYLAVFCIAGLFIYLMMKRTVQQMEKLQEVAGKQEMLMGALAHEMKTPLTSIIGYSDTLRHVKLNDEQKDRALEHISREGKRLEKLSGKMLQMLGLHQNDSIKMESHSIGELLEHVVQLEAEQAAQRQIQLQTEYEDFSMKMDDELMESLLVNLIDNALRATEAGGRITVKAYKESGRKILEVADNGRGIPQEELGKITEAFYMVDKSRSRQEGGAGLGLALCVKIAEVHGGRLDITSQLGTGTKVRVIFDKKK